MTGTARSRGRRSWEIRFDAGRDPLTQRRRFHSRSIRGSRRGQCRDCGVQTSSALTIYCPRCRVNPRARADAGRTQT